MKTIVGMGREVFMADIDHLYVMALLLIINDIKGIIAIEEITEITIVNICVIPGVRLEAEVGVILEAEVVVILVATPEVIVAPQFVNVTAVENILQTKAG